MKNRNKLLTLLLSVVVAWLLAANAAAQDAFIYNVPARQRLTNGDVVSIALDKRGLLWLATEEGLNCYDGATFHHYYKSDQSATKGIADNELSYVIDDPTEPVLWIGSQRAGLTAYNYYENTFRHYRHQKDNPKSLSYNGVTCIRPAGEGRLWVAGYDGGINLMNIETGECEHFNTKTIKGLPSNHVWTIADDGQGHLYVGHVSHGGMSVIDLRQRTAVNFRPQENLPSGLPGEEVRAICIASDGFVYLGTSKGLARFDPLSRVFTHISTPPGIPQPHVYDLREVSGGRLLVATEQHGVMELYLQGGRNALPMMHTLELNSTDGTAQAFTHQSVRCLFEDNAHNIWAGLWANGVNIINRTPPLFSYRPYQILHPSKTDITWRTVACVLTDEAGNLWVGTDGAGINRFEGHERIAVYNKDGGHLRGNSVQAALRDSRGQLWWGVYLGGAVCQDPHTGAMQQLFQGGWANVDVRVFLEHPKLGMLVGTSSGVFVIDKESRKIISHHRDDVINRTRALAIDRKGRIYIGCYDGGIRVYSPQWKLLAHYQDGNSALPSNTVNALVTDRQGMIWAGTNDGLVRLNPVDGTMKVYKRGNGLMNTHIRALQEDRQGRLWIATNRGISCVWKDHVYNFNEQDQLQTGYFMDRASTLAADGTLYFGSIDGLCNFNPDVIMRQQKTPKPSINNIAVLGDNDSIARVIGYKDFDNVSVDYDENTLRIGFNIPNLAETRLFNYAYRIIGLNESWHPIDTPGTLILRNLPPGDYKIEIRVSQDGNEEMVETVRLNLSVNPPFWRSWWAWLLYLLAISGLVIFVFVLYRRRLQAESRYHIEEMQRHQEQNLNQERLRFYTNITHELRTPLTLILGPLDDLRANVTLTADVKKRLGLIQDNAKRLLQLVNQLLEFRTTETQNKKLVLAHGNVGELVQEIALRYKELNQNPKVRFVVDTNTADTAMDFDREILTTILNNLISNAIKYTPEGEIRIACLPADDNTVEVSVADTGYGIDKEALPHIFERYYQAKSAYQASGTGIGLALVKSLIEIHGADITVESEPGKGTRFCVGLKRTVCDESRKHGNPAIVTLSNQQAKEINHALQADNDNANVMLVVEDNADIREYVAASFADDFTVLTAADGAEGWKIAKEQTPDIIISDIMMPVMDGIELCKKVKEDLRTSHIPVILLTAKTALDEKEEGYDSGADSYITKPFSAKLLKARVHNLLESRRMLTKLILSRALNDVTIAVEKQPFIAQKASLAPPQQSQREGQDAKEGKGLSLLDEKFMNDLNEIIEANLRNEQLDVKFLCAHFGMSQSSLYRKIKAITGLTGNVLIRKKRLHHALSLMSEGSHNVSEAAYSCGFNDVAYFRACFKDGFGMNPTEYIKRGK